MGSGSRGEVGLHLERAAEAHRAATDLLRDGLTRDAASRAYYAMYHASHALLRSRGLVAKTHKGLLSLVAEHFVQSGRRGREHFAALRAAKELREESDYDVGVAIEEAEVQRTLHDAEAFLHAVEALLA